MYVNMSPRLRWRQMNPRQNLVQRSFATNIEYTSPPSLPVGAYVLIFRQHRATQIHTSRGELEDENSWPAEEQHSCEWSCELRHKHFAADSSPARHSTTSASPFSLLTNCLQTGRKCTLQRQEGLHLPTETPRRQHSWPTGTWRRLQSMSPNNCHARDCQQRALRARFVARPLSVDRISDMLSPRG